MRCIYQCTNRKQKIVDAENFIVFFVFILIFWIVFVYLCFCCYLFCFLGFLLLFVAM